MQKLTYVHVPRCFFHRINVNAAYVGIRGGPGPVEGHMYTATCNVSATAEVGRGGSRGGGGGEGWGGCNPPFQTPNE